MNGPSPSGCSPHSLLIGACPCGGTVPLGESVLDRLRAGKLVVRALTRGCRPHRWSVAVTGDVVDEQGVLFGVFGGGLLEPGGLGPSRLITVKVEGGAEAQKYHLFGLSKYLFVVVKPQATDRLLPSIGSCQPRR